MAYHWIKARAKQNDLIEKTKAEVVDHSMHRIDRAKKMLENFINLHGLKYEIPDTLNVTQGKLF